MYVAIADKYILLPLLLFLDNAMMRIPDYFGTFPEKPRLYSKTELKQFYVVNASKTSPNCTVSITLLQITGKNMRIFCTILIPFGVLLVFVHRY